MIEATSKYGGRFKTDNDFTDFPIPLGAEWLHVSARELGNIVNDPSVNIDTQLTSYAPEDTYGYYQGGELTVERLGWGVHAFSDKKFIGSSWFDFFEDYIVPPIKKNMRLDTPIASIDYSGDKVVARDTNGVAYTADKLIFTAPLKLLQLNQFQFAPPLPIEKQRVIADAKIWSGIKVFIKFSEKFYPTFLEFPDSDTPEGQWLFYDAAYGQVSGDNILGLFAVGEPAERYINRKEGDLQGYILRELDQIFDGQATKSFEGILVQNWSDEPYARAAYLGDHESTKISKIMSRSIDDKLYFAGSSYTREDDWGSVHNAARSACDAVQELIR